MSPFALDRRRPPFVPGLRGLRILWRTLPQVVVAALGVLAAWALDAPAPVASRVRLAAAFLLGYALLRALVSEVLSPLRPSLRLVPLEDRTAARLEGALLVLLKVLFLTELGARLVRDAGWVPAVAAALGVVRDVTLVGFAAAACIGSGLLGRLASRGDAGLRGALGAIVARMLFPLAVATALHQVVTRGLGYEPFARWVLKAAAWTAVQFVVLALSFRFARRALRRAVTLGGARATGAADGPSPSALGTERIGTGLLRLVGIVGGALWILAAWGFGPSTIASALDRPVLSGGVHTWGAVAGGAVRVGAVILVGWLVRDLLTFFAFPRARVEVGVRYAILAMLRYVVVAAASLFSLAAIGVDPSSLAWFVGAAGIGIGLGLQDVIGNFFGGLIMLIERPIRVGDFVRVGGTSGTVEAIRIRGTMLRTLENATVLVPNRQMLAERLTNLSYGIDRARIDVAVGVAQGSDPARVLAALCDTARRHPDVLATPDPWAEFARLGDASLDFVVYAYVRDPFAGGRVASELRVAIVAAFAAAGIELAPARRVVLAEPAAVREKSPPR